MTGPFKGAKKKKKNFHSNYPAAGIFLVFAGARARTSLVSVTHDNFFVCVCVCAFAAANGGEENKTKKKIGTGPFGGRSLRVDVKFFQVPDEG